MLNLKWVILFLLPVYGLVAQEVNVVKYEKLQEVIAAEKDKVLVVNFWATWCGPCITELPHFMEVNREYKGDPGFKMILVSLDQARQLDRVKQLISRKKLETEHYLLDDNARMNDWIPKFDPGWGGGIPATFIYKNGVKAEFKESGLSKSELKNLISKHKN
ncbi:MAG: TlpA family protein disulfide reductase [Leadbetterella sp.]|nr:TlpA family protein disulfide reductase [Leadbetterella sp.]